MNWDAIGAFGELFGALAVLLTLLYLATQVKQTNDISRFNTTNDEFEQVYTFTNMFCNAWAMCQIAFSNGLIDEGFFDSAKPDVSFEIERWPKFKSNVLLWLERYPDFKEYAIFSSLKHDNEIS